MILDKPGQTFGYCKKTFTVGGTVWVAGDGTGTEFATVKQIFTGTDSVSGPTALCEYEDGRSERMALYVLEPVAERTPEKEGQLYALFFYCDGSDGTWTQMLGLSADQGVLLKLMRDDIAQNPEAELTHAHRDTDKDSLYFTYENTEKADALYVEYSIEPAPVFPWVKGGDVE